jgi:hypothetical protein
MQPQRVHKQQVISRNTTVPAAIKATIKISLNSDACGAASESEIK